MGTEKRERQKQGRQARLEAAREAQRKRQRRRRNTTIVVASVVILGGLFAYSTFFGDDKNESADSTTTTLGPTECAPDTKPPEPVLHYSEPFPDDCLDSGATYQAVFDTNEGEITVDLDTENTPNTVNNFVNLARNGYYDGTKIFRTDTSIGIIQGGSPDTNDASDPGPGYNIEDEGDGYTYEPGQLVMARGSSPNSAAAQFFFVGTDAASALDDDGSYVVFGTTDQAGIDVINAILALNQDDPSSGLGGAPSRPVKVRSVTIVERGGADSTTTTTAAASDATTTTTG